MSVGHSRELDHSYMCLNQSMIMCAAAGHSAWGTIPATNRARSESAQQLTKHNQIRNLLLGDCSRRPEWPHMPTDGRQASMKEANKFMLCSLMDYDQTTDAGWESANVLSEEILGDPDDLWGAVLVRSPTLIRQLFQSRKLHPSDGAADMIIEAARNIKGRYGGDASKIWADREPDDTVQRLLGVNVDKKTVGIIEDALYDTKQLSKWPWMPSDGSPVSKKDANKFMLYCIMDYQMRTWMVWRNAKRFSQGILGDPDDLWGAILDMSEPNAVLLFKNEKLHRFPSCGERVWRCAKHISNNYSGDAREMWKGRITVAVRESFQAMHGIGSALSRMIVGALIDTKQIEGVGDLKADMHVRRVLGRVFTGNSISANKALETAREIMQDNSWKIDEPLFEIGKHRCRPKVPFCSSCCLQVECSYALSGAVHDK